MFTELKTWTCILSNTLLSHLCTIDIHWTVLNVIPQKLPFNLVLLPKIEKTQLLSLTLFFRIHCRVGFMFCS